jgi:hypothetical protein
MPEILEEFDGSHLEVRESEVLGVLSQHLAALNPQQLLSLKKEGAVLIDLHALDAGNHFESPRVSRRPVGLSQTVAA